MQKFYIPNFKTGAGFTRENLDGLAALGVLQGNIKAFASKEDWLSKSFYLPTNGAPKFWRDNAAIWSPDQGAFDYVFVAKDGTNNFIKAAINWSDESFNFYSPAAAQFYHAYVNVGHFKNIPILRKRTVSSSEAKRMSFPGNNAGAEFPVSVFIADPTGPIDAASRSTFPSNCALIFEGDEVVCVKIEEYIKENPIKNVSLPPQEIVLSDEEFVEAAEMLLKNVRLSAADKRNEIRKLV